MAIPDLCFYFLHANEQLRIEFKTFYPAKGGIIGATNKQIATWSSSSTPGAPQLWIAIERPDRLLVWRHDDPAYQQNLASAEPATKSHYHVRVPTQQRHSFVEAFLQVMQHARDRKLLV